MVLNDEKVVGTPSTAGLFFDLIEEELDPNEAIERDDKEVLSA